MPPDLPIPHRPDTQIFRCPTPVGPRPARRTRPTHAWPTAAAISADALAPSLSFLSSLPRAPGPRPLLLPPPAPPGRALHRGTPRFGRAARPARPVLLPARARPAAARRAPTRAPAARCLPRTPPRAVPTRTPAHTQARAHLNAGHGDEPRHRPLPRTPPGQPVRPRAHAHAALGAPSCDSSRSHAAVPSQPRTLAPRRRPSLTRYSGDDPRTAPPVTRPSSPIPLAGPACTATALARL